MQGEAGEELRTYSDPVLVKTEGLAQLRRPSREDADHSVGVALRQALQPLQGRLQPAAVTNDSYEVLITIDMIK